MVDGKSVRFTGSGPGVQSKDGCSVELYKRFPYYGEVDFLPSFLPAGATVLELGCGVGRLTRPMLARGLHVTAVDNSPDMLEHAPAAATKICADIEALCLDQQFDAVLLASNLINVPGSANCDKFLNVCNRHVKQAGVLFFERHDPEWLNTIRCGPVGKTHPVKIVVESFARDNDVLHVQLAYHAGDQIWEQTFSTKILDDDAVSRVLLRSGFGAPEWIDRPRRRWGVCKRMNI
jgi:SAM-dependent methyltransferase